MSGSVKEKTILAILCAGVLLCGCRDTAADGGDLAGQQGEVTDFVITAQDNHTDSSGAQKIDLGVCGEQLTITEGGDYLLCGSMEGQVFINAYEDELVHLYLSDAQITSPHGPAICAVSAAKLIVTLVSDTTNTLSDTPDYTEYEETKSCLYSAADLTINGDGTLWVYGYYEDAIRSKDEIRIVGGVLDIQAKGDGIRGNDGIVIKSGAVKIQSEGWGLRTTNSGTGTRGNVELSGGSINIIAGKNAISAASDLSVHDCALNAYGVEETFRAEGTQSIDEGCMQ
jgi:hypothetical protein